MTPSASKGKTTYLPAVILLCAVIAAYSNHFHNSLHFDDSHVVANNVYIKSLRNIPLFFKDATTISSLPANQVYRPVVITSLALDYWMGNGLNDTFYFHLSMFVLFIVQGLFMYLLSVKIFDGSRAGAGNSTVALLAVAWYLLHPANAETINYISARSDTLSTLFGLISMVLFLYSPFCRTRLIYFIPLTVAVLAKPIAIVFVALLMIYLHLFEDAAAGPVSRKKKDAPSGSGNVLQKTWPVILYSLFLMLFTKAMTPHTFAPGGAQFFNYVITQPSVILRYFTTFFLPISLSADTDWTPLASVADSGFLIGSLFLAALLYAAFVTAKSRTTRPIAFGILWFLIALLPTSLFPLAEVMNDHRIFFPYIGLSLSICWSIFLALEKIKGSFSSEKTFYRNAIIVISIVLAGYAYGVHERNKVWRTEESLWYDVTRKSPKNGRGLMNYGLTLMARADYAGAERYFTDALRLTPNYSYLHTNMGIIMNATGRPAEAEGYFRKAISLDPNNPECYHYYGVFLNNRDRPLEAISQFLKALELAPAHLEARHALMSTYFGRSDTDKLHELAAETLRIAPNDREAAGYLTAVNKGASASDRAEESVRMNRTPENLLNLSLVYYNAREYRKSIEAARAALELRPGYDLAYNNLCAAYNELGQWDKAIEAGEKAVQLNPGNQLARNNLAAARKRKLKKP